MLDLKALLTDERGHLAAALRRADQSGAMQGLQGPGLQQAVHAGQRGVPVRRGGQPLSRLPLGLRHVRLRAQSSGDPRIAIQQAMDLDLPNLVAMGVASLSGLLARELIRICAGRARHGVLRQQRHRRGRGGDQVRPLRHGQAADDPLRAVVSRAEPGLAVGQRQRRIQRGLRPDAGADDGRPLQRSRSARARAVAGRRRRLHRRADSGERRLRSQRRLPARSGRAVPQARGHLHCRRGADGVGPHGQDVRLRALGRRTRHPDHRPRPFRAVISPWGPC